MLSDDDSGAINAAEGRSVTEDHVDSDVRADDMPGQCLRCQTCYTRLQQGKNVTQSVDHHRYVDSSPTAVTVNVDVHASPSASSPLVMSPVPYSYTSFVSEQNSVCSDSPQAEAEVLASAEAVRDLET